MALSARWKFLKPWMVAVFFATAGCATVDPYLKPIASCAGKTVSPADASEAFADLLSQNWADLAAEGVRLGYDVLDCIITSIETQAPGLKPSAASFRSLHSAEFRAAGVSASNDSRPPKALQAAASPRDTADGKLSLADCAARADTSDVIAPPSGCWAWRADRKDWRRSRWVRL
jgi:hypothetical protein